MFRRKLILLVLPVSIIAACNNAKTDKNNEPVEIPGTLPGTNVPANIPVPVEPTGATLTYSIDSKENKIHGSALVSKDKRNLMAGDDYMAVVTAHSDDTASKEAIVLNFVFALKAGTYPIVGYSLTRHVDGHAQMFGGLLGGEPKISPYKVNITSCINPGGHHWVISGNTEGPITIPAMGIMLMSKTNNHPKDITIDKISFDNLQFDDNWDELMEKAGENMKLKIKP